MNRKAKRNKYKKLQRELEKQIKTEELKKLRLNNEAMRKRMNKEILYETE